MPLGESRCAGSASSAAVGRSGRAAATATEVAATPAAAVWAAGGQCPPQWDYGGVSRWENHLPLLCALAVTVSPYRHKA